MNEPSKAVAKLLRFNPSLEIPWSHFVLARQLERQRLAVCKSLAAIHGETGPMISGGIYRNWPEHWTMWVGQTCRTYNGEVDAGFRARPFRVKESTMKRLWMLSASIA